MKVLAGSLGLILGALFVVGVGMLLAAGGLLLAKLINVAPGLFSSLEGKEHGLFWVGAIIFGLTLGVLDNN